MVDGFEKFMRTAEERGMRFAVFVGRRNLREEELDLAGAGESVIRIVPVIQGSKSSGIFQTVLGRRWLLRAISRSVPPRQ